eukprot:scaffold367636_cov38-Prasinocladus_malaysianus.AAC.1
MGSQQHRELYGGRGESRNAVTKISKYGKKAGSGWAESLASPFFCRLGAGCFLPWKDPTPDSSKPPAKKYKF